ncbi:MAG: M55 family metallopeptidase [Clostridiales bacterium]|nr:M55 family metallopeptidase [Clostridiales bacterium]
MNRIFFSCDIEGTCGIAHWDETQLGHADHTAFRRQMSLEAAAACRGALAGGADDLFVKDAHDSARNILPELLPEEAQIFRGWGSDIHSMVSGIDESFAGCIFTGYHSSSNTDDNPLSHTMNTKNTSIRVNGMQASEMLMNAFSAALYDVPVLLVTGDEGVCRQARTLLPNVHTVAVSRGRGNGSVSMHPEKAVRLIREEAEKAVAEGLAHPERFVLALPQKFDVEVEYVHHSSARRAGFYPGARQTGSRTVVFSSDAWYDCLRFFMFCL